MYDEKRKTRKTKQKEKNENENENACVSKWMAICGKMAMEMKWKSEEKNILIIMG